MHWLLPASLAAVFFLLAPTHGLISVKATKARCPTRVLKGGRVRIRNKGKVIRYVCLRGYQILGNKYSTCIRGRWDSPAPVCIKEGCDTFTVAHGQVLETYRGAFTTVHCDPGYSLVGNQGLYCNGAVWNDTRPTCREIEGTAQKECDFESEDLCGWSHDANQDFTWKRNKFTTPSGYAGTGPSFDHTLGRGFTGHYMYLESSSPRLENDTARLYSPVFKMPTNESSCFIFWYHMFGHTTGSLNVYVHGKDSDLLFSRSGDQGDKWLEAVLPLPTVDSSFQIMIEGVRGGGYEGDIAIDDVKLTGGDECEVLTPTSDETIRASDDSTCENRCHRITNDLSLCECVPDCITNNTCCPDYLQFCATTTEVSEWSTSQSEAEMSTLDDTFTDDSTDLPSSPTVAGVIGTTVNTSFPVKTTSILNPTFLASTMPVQNSTPVTEYVTPTDSYTMSLYKTKTKSTTFRERLLETTPSRKLIDLKPQTNSSPSLTNYKSATLAAVPSFSSQDFENSLLNNTSPSIYTPTVSSRAAEKSKSVKNLTESSLKSSNRSTTKTSTSLPVMKYSQTLYRVVQPTTKSVYPGIQENKKKIKNRYVNVTKSTLSTERSPITNTIKTVAIVEQISSSTAYSNQKETYFTSTIKPHIEINVNKSIITQTYPKRVTINKPTKKSFVTPTSSSMRKNKIIFNTPPDIVLRTPKPIINQQPIAVSPKVTTNSGPKYINSSLSPKYFKNLTNNEVKSRNDFVYKVWKKLNLTVPAFTKSSSKSSQATSVHTSTSSQASSAHTSTSSQASSAHTSTSLPSTSTTRSLHSTVLSFDYENAVETKSRSKHKFIDTVSAPNIAPLTRQSSSMKAEQILVWFGLVLLVLSTVLVFSVCVIRRKRINRRLHEDDELDIRFLAADEMLDFTIARPEVLEERTL